MWIPNANAPEGVNAGTIIHVTGDASNGFEHQFKRNYVLSGTTRRHKKYPLGQAHANAVVDPPYSHIETEDKSAIDAIEQHALAVAAPGESLASAADPGTRLRVVILNCQTWMRDFVGALISNDVLPASSMTVVNDAPVNA